MKASALFKEYVWLVGTIRRAGRITLREINERWLRTAMSDGVEFSRTTFRRHRTEVEEMFGIIIDCDNENRYYIDDAELFREESVQQWMLSTLTVSNIVSEARGLHDRILLESIPSESEHLPMVVEPMRDLPLHHSQKELAVGTDYVDFEVCLHPTSDFLAQILSRGRWLKVLEPKEIAEKIKQLHLEAAEE